MWKHVTTTEMSSVDEQEGQMHFKWMLNWASKSSVIQKVGFEFGYACLDQLLNVE